MFGRHISKKTGEILTPRHQVAANFRRMLERLHAGWDPSFEIYFWRRGTEMVCEISDAFAFYDLARIASIKRRGTQMEEDPKRLIFLKRHMLGLTIEQASKKAMLSTTHWCLIERGRRKLGVNAAAKIALALDIPLRALLPGWE